MNHLEELAKVAPAKETDEQMMPTFCSMCGPTMGCGINCYVKDRKLITVVFQQDLIRLL